MVRVRKLRNNEVDICLNELVSIQRIKISFFYFLCVLVVVTRLVFFVFYTQIKIKEKMAPYEIVRRSFFVLFDFVHNLTPFLCFSFALIPWI